MKVINLDKNITLAERVLVAETFFSRLKGLLTKKELPAKEALIIKHCNSIHTFFMRFPIDVLFVDKNNRVIKAISSLKPYRLTPIYFQARFAIELPSGIIQASSTQAGDTISLI